MTKILIFIPTYNERENLEPMHAHLRRLGLDADILILDDNSPDGTGQIADRLAKEDRRTFVIHRAGKQGIGGAHLAGIRWAYERGYETLVTMDCDFTHQPEDIPVFINASKDHDLVVGSRYMRRESLRDWNLFRKTLTFAGHLLTKHLLHVPQDATGAFRLYRLDRIPREIFDLVKSRGYSFFFESLFVLHRNGFRIQEIAIDLPARTYGHSKMTVRDATNSLRFLLRTFFRYCADKKSYHFTEPLDLPDGLRAKGQQEWDEYWGKQKKSGKGLYDGIAAFYRRFIIKRALNEIIRREFGRGAELLHAGCGSGQVDEDIVRNNRVIALDISQAALQQYQKVNGRQARLVQGSIFDIPLEENSVDGVYNLGVMEHFSEAEIQQILAEFRRVLRPQGKIALFWPPEFGLSVNALKAAHFALNNLLKKNIKLHPDEITRILSKRHAEQMIEKAGFRMTRYEFGLRDFFTHSIVVAQCR